MTLTPFRYPGAKNKLLKTLMPHIDIMMMNQDAFCDAFVGGGSVMLEVATKYPKAHIYINDKDVWMYSFWDIVCGDCTHQLSDLLNLIDQPVTLEQFYKLRASQESDRLECAYKAIFFNRTTFSGIFRSGPIGGKNQKSDYPVDCRYNAGKIKKKINSINKLLAGRTIVSDKDINDYLPTIKCPIYLDPPYYIKGSQLYTEFMKPAEHEKMRDILRDKENWLLSYDDCPEVRELYKDFTLPTRIFTIDARYCINGEKTDWADKNEVLIYKPQMLPLDQITIKLHE